MFAFTTNNHFSQEIMTLDFEFPTLRRYIPVAILFSCLSVSAQQEEVVDWYQNNRPEHVHDYADGGVRRLPFKIGSRETAALSSIGSPKVPIVLVQFADRSFAASGKTDEEIVQSYSLFFNGLDNTEVKTRTNSRGSVKRYFMDQSLEQFSPEFEIIGPVTLDKGYAEYGRNNGSSKDVGMSSFYREALNKAVKDHQVDWSKFDNDKNNTVDMVFFIHAGWGENTVAEYDSDAIWAKESTTSLRVEVDETSSVVFGCYGVCAEARVRSKSQLIEDIASGNYGKTGYNPENLRMDGIGVCIHELSHALGLPDFYDTRSVAFGMDLWSVMDYGEYGNNGYTPGNYTAYERNFMGWQPLVELNDTSIINVKCFADGGIGYKIVNEANEDEYYVLENRQPQGWDEAVGKLGHGLMVTHVDYQAGRWSNNTVNTDPNHQCMTIIAANDNYNGTNAANSSEEWVNCLAGNLFPYVTPNQSLTDETSPAAKVYAGGLMHKPIYNITQEEDGSVTVYFLKSQEDYNKDLNDAICQLNKDTLVDIYDMNGVHICRCQPDEIYRQVYHHGIYLVKFPDGTVRKVLMK